MQNVWDVICVQKFLVSVFINIKIKKSWYFGGRKRLAFYKKLVKVYLFLSDSVCVCVCVCGIMVKVFTNGLGDQGSIPGRVIPKTQKMVLDVSLFNTQHYEVQIKGKWSNWGKGVAPSLTTWCSSYWKGSLLITLNYGQST